MPKIDIIDVNSKKKADIHIIAIDYGDPHVHVFMRSKKKRRGWKIKHVKAVKVSNITEEGFWVHTYLKNYYISRILFPWFLGATDNEIRDVELLTQHRHDEDGNHYDRNDEHWDILYWKSLNVDIGTLSISYPQLLSFEWKVKQLENPKLTEQFDAEIQKRGWQRYQLTIEGKDGAINFFAENDEEAAAIANWHIMHCKPRESGYSYRLWQQERLIQEDKV